MLIFKTYKELECMDDKKTLEELKEKYGKLLRFTSTTTAEVAYCKIPDYQTYLKYLELYKDNVHEAIVYIFNACVLNAKEYDEDFVLSSGNAIIETVKKASLFAINPTPQEDEFKKSAALIRYYFKVNPYELPMDEFYKLLEEALWVQKHNNNKLENLLQQVMVQNF